MKQKEKESQVLAAEAEFNRLNRRVQELEDGSVVFVESNKLTVRYHTICPRTIEGLKQQLRYVNIFIEVKFFS